MWVLPYNLQLIRKHCRQPNGVSRLVATLDLVCSDLSVSTVNHDNRAAIPYLRIPLIHWLATTEAIFANRYYADDVVVSHGA